MLCSAAAVLGTMDHGVDLIVGFCVPFVTRLHGIRDSEYTDAVTRETH